MMFFKKSQIWVMFLCVVSAPAQCILWPHISDLTRTEECLTPDPIDPEDIEIAVDFEPDPADLVLSSLPGGELFDPRKHRFNEEDLKPQPMIKKAKKIFVPEEHKVGV